jgi:hypothetical protein
MGIVWNESIQVIMLLIDDDMRSGICSGVAKGGPHRLCLE